VITMLVSTSIGAETNLVLDFFQPHVFTDDALPEGLPYRLMSPIEIAPGQKYPLVVFLHGFGERGSDNERQLGNGGPIFATDAFRTAHPAFFVAPQCPDGFIPGTEIERAWTWRLEPGAPAKIDLNKAPTPQLAAVQTLIAQLSKENPIDPDRIYLVGLSMGGYAVWELATRSPHAYAAAIPICGSGDPSHADVLTDLPIWAFHGGADDIVPPERSIEMVDAVNGAGGHAILTLYPGVGHGSWVPMFESQEAWDWLFAQHRGRK